MLFISHTNSLRKGREVVGWTQTPNTSQVPKFTGQNNERHCYSILYSMADLQERRQIGLLGQAYFFLTKLPLYGKGYFLVH